MSLPVTPKPRVEERLNPDAGIAIEYNGPLPDPEAALDEATFCPRCATLGQRVLLSGMHFRRRDGTAITEFGCPCGYTKTVEYRPR
jgi:hypothetical protein